MQSESTLNTKIGELDNTEFLDSIIKQIEDYYGVSVYSANDIKIKIFNDLVVGIGELPDCFKIRHKGGIVTGKLGNITYSMLLGIRSLHEKEKFTAEDWESCLLPFSESLFFCEESHTIYNIDDSIGKYLVKYNCSDLIFKYASNKQHVPVLKGETVKIYDTFIRKGSSINDKKYILDIDDTNNAKDNRPWVISYIENLYTKDKKLRDLKVSARVYLNKKAESCGIIYNDLLFRVSTGMSVEEAIRLGEQESKKYGVKYSEIADNNNFISYLKYLAKQEDL